MFEANYSVVFIGAGISTESGLSDLRGSDGIHAGSVRILISVS